MKIPKEGLFVEFIEVIFSILVGRKGFIILNCKLTTASIKRFLWNFTQIQDFE